ncbi:saccharopine dehydrogenase NADP-binding domain-containing protein [Nonomuraea sp. H19]|uniref:saccharopine dehydrogenase NADP-binding domain-containing protein n=1 Tax=Nonomuraea sp. H19 TaxID=3452206 RepID=UPI003F896D59
MTGRVVGVIGGYGSVGGHAARLIRRCGFWPLRVGGRDPRAARRFADDELRAVEPAEASGDVEAAEVDVADGRSLAAFVRDCALVVNCAGPSHRISESVALAALGAGADYVDAGGGEHTVERLTRAVAAYPDRRTVFFAGALPGLSGLLPRWLAASGDGPARELTVYAGVLDRFTAAGAEDYLHGVLHLDNVPGGAWRDGRVQARALTRRTGVRLPFFSGEVSALPYLDAECERVARDLGLGRGSWYSVLDGRHLAAALDRARGLPGAEAVAELCRATALDVAGRTPYVTFLAQLDSGPPDGRTSRTAVLRGTGISELTGAVTAAAALAVLHGEIPPGAHHAATALDPVTAMDRLRAMSVLSTGPGSAAGFDVPGAASDAPGSGGVAGLVVVDAAIEELSTVEEGAL